MMIEKSIESLAAWAKRKSNRKNFLGLLIRLIYEICVNSFFQSAVHVFASCLLGAYCYANGKVNYKFLIPFGLIYLAIIIVFAISNQHRKIRNDLIKEYEISYSKITRALQEQCRKELELYNIICDKSFEKIVEYYSDHDIYTETCFRICVAVDELLQEISGTNSFKVMTFLRTKTTKDEYHVNAFSPQDPAPEMYGNHFELDTFRKMEKKNIPVHARPFLNSRFDPVIYVGDEVEKKYTDFNKNHPTRLHISIPCSVNGAVVAVLQITSYEDCLGPKSNIKALIDNVIGIYICYLKTTYIQQIKHERLASSLNEALGEI